MRPKMAKMRFKMAKMRPKMAKMKLKMAKMRPKMGVSLDPDSIYQKGRLVDTVAAGFKPVSMTPRGLGPLKK